MIFLAFYCIEYVSINSFNHFLLLAWNIKHKWRTCNGHLFFDRKSTNNDKQSSIWTRMNKVIWNWKQSQSLWIHFNLPIGLKYSKQFFKCLLNGTSNTQSWWMASPFKWHVQSLNVCKWFVCVCVVSLVLAHRNIVQNFERLCAHKPLCCWAHNGKMRKQQMFESNGTLEISIGRFQSLHIGPVSWQVTFY